MIPPWDRWFADVQNDYLGFPSGSVGDGNGNPLQYSCLENPTGGGAW